MGYIPSEKMPDDMEGFKALLEPYADNDFIRNAVYAQVAASPGKKISLK